MVVQPRKDFASELGNSRTWAFLIFARFLTWVFAREFCHVKSHVTRARDKIHVKYDVIKVTWQTCIFFRQFARPLSPRKRPYFRPLFLLSPTFATFFFSTYWYGNHRSRVIWGGEHPWWCSFFICTTPSITEISEIYPFWQFIFILNSTTLLSVKNLQFLLFFYISRNISPVDKLTTQVNSPTSLYPWTSFSAHQSFSIVS